MIVEMKKVTILSEQKRKKEVISSLRKFGLVHVEDVVNKTSSTLSLENANDTYNKVASFLDGFVDKKNPVKSVSIDKDKIDEVCSSINSLIQEEAKLNERNRSLNSEVDRIKQFGNFDPKEIEKLNGEGINLSCYFVGKKEKLALRENKDVTFVSVKTDSTNDCVCLINSSIPQGIAATEIVMPNTSLLSMEDELFINKKRIEEINSIYKESICYCDSIKSQIKKNDEEIFYLRVTDTAKDVDSVTYISGYIPAEKIDEFKSFCTSNKLGYLIDDPKDEENPPTLLKHKGFIKFVQPLYDALGLVPGYREKDISVYFLVFMSLFTAMILGDAGYGLILFLCGILLNVKSKKCSDMNALLYLFSGATIVWGAITGTWFGSELILEKLPFLRIFVIPGLTNFPALFNMDANLVQNNVMTFCFSVGAIHLSLARAICIFDKIKSKDLSLLADFGWLMNTVLLYLLSLYLVVHATVPLGTIALGVGIGFVLVCLFGSVEPDKPLGQGIKESLGSFFTNFLDTISCFSNVMSYIRLFAVGLASLAIAQSFNGMAEGLMSGFTIPFGILILLLGHGVNLIMGFLSVVVHGVRLNIMEFSGQVGVEWSGYKYEPFALKGDKEKEETQRS